ncbi:Nitroreductase family protein [Jatrophihabitans endophyticus]|uniref:Nitroreductase family protein n=1 Tax=Jatrophihabitans endophyticus TaxID=1206085 RepID=A0A1M5CIF6_9ACTN|nr:nitroreductase family protein [Jatrophihabitans endophyticus]SHF54533.1 Nitroreductase family protein [Jatrophihabitans endophyticus]
MPVLASSTVSQALRRAAVRATLAPSVHNTQPWRFVLGPDFLEVHADSARRLTVLDPSGRQLIISCGCALFNARVSLAAAGFRAGVERVRDPQHPTLLARITVDGETAPGDPETEALAALDPVVELRRTNRRQFADDPVPQELVESLVAAAAAEHAELDPVVRAEDRVVTAVLSQRADQQQNADPAYRAELRAWTSDDPRRDDGVPSSAVPHAVAGGHDEIPIRDFDTHGTGALPTETRSNLHQCLLLLGTSSDDTDAWLRAGEALERILLEITRHGFVASPLTQVIEVPVTRGALRRELRLATQPHVLLRVGRAAPTPAPRRRRLVDMLSDAP